MKDDEPKPTKEMDHHNRDEAFLLRTSIYAGLADLGLGRVVGVQVRVGVACPECDRHDFPPMRAHPVQVCTHKSADHAGEEAQALMALARETRKLSG